MLAPAAFTSWAIPSVSSFFSTAQGPAMIATFLLPTFTPLTSMIVSSFLNSRPASFHGARIGTTSSTPGMARSGWLASSRSSPITPMMVRSCPFERWGLRPSSRTRSITCSISFSVASGFSTIIMKRRSLSLAQHCLEGCDKPFILMGQADRDPEEWAVQVPHDDAPAEQGLEHGLAVLFHVEVQEIGLAGGNGEPQGPEPLRQVGHPLGVQPAALADVLFVREGGQRGLLREAVRVERRPDTVQVLHERRDLGGRDVRTGRIVRVADERQPRLRRDGFGHGGQVVAVILQRYQDRL